MVAMSPFKASSSIMPSLALQTPTYHPDGYVAAPSANFTRPSAINPGMAMATAIPNYSSHAAVLPPGTIGSTGGPATGIRGTGGIGSTGGPATGGGTTLTGTRGGIGSTGGPTNPNKGNRATTNARINAVMGYNAQLHDPALEHQIRQDYFAQYGQKHGGQGGIGSTGGPATGTVSNPVPSSVSGIIGSTGGPVTGGPTTGVIGGVGYSGGHSFPGGIGGPVLPIYNNSTSHLYSNG